MTATFNKALDELGYAIAPPTDEAGALDRLLQLAQIERRLCDSPAWRTNTEQAIEAHGEAVGCLYAELYRLLDARLNAGKPLPEMAVPVDVRKELKKQIVARVKTELPALVASIIDEF